MGYKYYLILKCAYCGKKNPKPGDDDTFWQADYIYYTENLDSTTFKCDYCKKKNKIIMDFRAEKIKNS